MLSGFAGTGLSGMRLRGGGRAAAWTPAALPGLAAAPVVSLMRAAGKMWEDAGETTPATADGQLVRVFQDTFTGLKWTALSNAARMTLTDKGGGKWCLTAAGTQCYAANSTAGFPTGTGPIFTAAAASPSSVGGFSYLFAIGADNDNQTWAVDLGTGGGGGNIRVVGFGADWTTGIPTQTGAAVIDCANNGATSDCFRDGVSGGTNARVPNIAYGRAHLGAWHSGIFGLVGELYGFILAGDIPADRTPVRDYLAGLLP